VPAPQNFDITMDLSTHSNVPLMDAPIKFWERINKIPIPTLEELSNRRLAIWVMRAVRVTICLNLSTKIVYSYCTDGIKLLPHHLGPAGLHARTSLKS
jgi:hypothetical protein